MDLPSGPGTYVLFLHLANNRKLTVGRLGALDFPAGFYAYVGSGQGSGGLAARIARHLRHPKPLHWHIDTLRTYARPLKVWLSEGPQQRECAWAQAMSQLAGASLPAPRFGATDCRCRAHLVHFTRLPAHESFAQVVGDNVREVVLNGSHLE